MRATVNTILIQCAECFEMHVEEGLPAMIAHIKEKHPEYRGNDPEIYATKWMEQAYEEEEKFLANYYDQKKLEDAIEADREFQTHKI